MKGEREGGEGTSSRACTHWCCWWAASDRATSRSFSSCVICLFCRAASSLSLHVRSKQGGYKDGEGEANLKTTNTNSKAYSAISCSRRAREPSCSLTSDSWAVVSLPACTIRRCSMSRLRVRSSSALRSESTCLRAASRSRCTALSSPRSDACFVSACNQRQSLQKAPSTDLPPISLPDFPLPISLPRSPSRLNTTPARRPTSRRRSSL